MMGEVIRVSGRAPDVGDLLREAMVSQKFADVALCCSGGQRFLAHRLVLSAASPYLQDVLLAHGKAAGYNEPITIILAEIEGAELSAILGLVYTGSATIQKSRFEAFTRAAETLHVTIPSFGGSTTFDHRHYQVLSAPSDIQDNCKLDSVKIEQETTRIDTSYLHCEKYPPYEGWFDSSSWHYNDHCLKRRNVQSENWIITKNNGLSRKIRRTNEHHPSYSRFLETTNIFHENNERNEKINFHENLEEAEKINIHENNNEKCETIKNHYHESKIIGTDRWLDNNSTNQNTLNLSVDPTTIRGIRSNDGNNDFPAQSVKNFIPTETLNSFSIHDNTSLDSSKIPLTGEKDRLDNDFKNSPVRESPVSSFTFDRTSLKTFAKQDYDSEPIGPTQQTSCGHLTVVDGTKIVSAGSACATVTSDVITNIGNSSIVREKPETCVENCCRWKIPRRHVANRVPASPWCQLARPAHHSPKTRPIHFRSRNENLEPVSRPGWNDSLSSHERTSTSPFAATAHRVENPEENSSSSTSSLPLNLLSNVINDSSGSMYNFKVPKTTEISSTINETQKIVDPTSLHYYTGSTYKNSSSLYSTNTISSTESAWKMSTNQIVRSAEMPESIIDVLQNQSTRLHRVRVSNISENHEESRIGICQHAISPNATDNNDSTTCNPQTSPRIELSHPVSRLCDIGSTNDEIIEQKQFSLETNNLTTSLNTVMMKDIAKDDEDTNFRLKPIYENSRTIIQSDDNNNEAGIDDSIIEITGNVDVESRVKNELPPSGEEICCNEEQHRCDQCGKTFVTRASLKVHGRTHSGEKPFRCTDCGKEFSQLRNYKYHRSVHEGTREFAATCPECGKYFNDRGYLSSHMKIHRNRKEYACKECGKSFNQRVAYNMHVRIHTGVKPHQCEQCGKAFSRKMLLKQHLRTHSGERPYQCQICQKAFADRSNMTLHTRLHSGLKPYQCTLCSKAFTKKHHLKTHLNYHTGTKPYSCPNCSLRFSQSSNMRTHYKKCSAISETLQNQGNTRGISAPSAAIVLNDKTPPVGNNGRTSSLTPPSSDQESSIIKATIITEERLRGYNNLRNKDINVTISDT